MLEVRVSTPLQRLACAVEHVCLSGLGPLLGAQGLQHLQVLEHQVDHLHSQATPASESAQRCWRLCPGLDLVEVLVALVGQGDGNGEDGVGGVLVEARLTVSSKQGQSPAPEKKSSAETVPDGPSGGLSGSELTSS